MRTLHSSYVVATILIISRAHTGTTNLGLNFRQVHSGWKTDIKEPFVAYLNNVFSVSPLVFYILTSINSHPAREMCQASALMGSTLTQDPRELSTMAGDRLHPDINSDDAKNEMVDLEGLMTMLDDDRLYCCDSSNISSERLVNCIFYLQC